jgi:putative redox protein
MEMDAKVSWEKRLTFKGKAEGDFIVPLGSSADLGGDDDGFRPMQLLLIGLAGCTAMDVISILQKKKQNITSFEVRVHADQADEHPKVFTSASIEYIVVGNNVEPAAVERAVQLSEEKYCPAQAMFRRIMPIELKITLGNH